MKGKLAARVPKVPRGSTEIKVKPIISRSRGKQSTIEFKRCKLGATGRPLLLCFQFKEGLLGITPLFSSVFVPNTNSSSLPHTANLHVPEKTEICRSPVRKVQGEKGASLGEAEPQRRCGGSGLSAQGRAPQGAPRSASPAV